MGEIIKVSLILTSGWGFDSRSWEWSSFKTRDGHLSLNGFTRYGGLVSRLVPIDTLRNQEKKNGIYIIIYKRKVLSSYFCVFFSFSWEYYGQILISIPLPFKIQERLDFNLTFLFRSNLRFHLYTLILT